MMKNLLIISVFVVAFGWANAQTWEPLGPSKFDYPSSDRVDFPKIAIDPEGTPYLAYDGVDGYIIRKFNGSTWETMGTFQAAFLNLIMDSLGTLYLAYSDKENDHKATVRKFNGTTWEPVGMAGFSKGHANFIKMVFDPVGTPYVVFTDEIDFKVTVMKFNGTSWEPVGNAGISQELAFYPTMAIGPNGTPYVAYRDVATGHRSTVIRFNGTDWETVGDAGFISAFAEPQIIIDQENTPYVAYSYSDTENDRRARVMKFNGSIWETVGGEVISQDVARPIIVKDPQGALYVCYQEGANVGDVTVMKFNGNTWDLVGIAGTTWGQDINVSMTCGSEGTYYIAYPDTRLGGRASVVKFNGSTWEQLVPSGILGTSLNRPSMDISFDGTPYVGFPDNANDRRVTVRRLIDNSWETVGNKDFTAEDVMGVNIAIDPAGTPYVAFEDSKNGYQLTVNKFDGTSWETVGHAGFTAVGASSYPIVIGPAGKPYVVITEGDIPKPLVMMFNGNDWEALTNLGIPDDVGIYPSIAFDKYNTLYLAYSSFSNHGKANVFKLNDTQWNRVGDANFSNDWVEGIKIVIDPNGTPYVLYEDYSSDDKATVKRFNGSTWEAVGRLDPRVSIFGSEPYFPDIAMAGDGTPYVTYGGDLLGNKTTVKRFNGEQWETVGDPDFTARQDALPIISIDDKGTIFLVYMDADLYAYKYESGEATPTTKELSIAKPTLKAWPNPFSEKLTIEFSSPFDTSARLEIYDTKGSKQAILFDSPVKMGQLYQREYLPLQKTNTVLFYRLTLGDQLFTGKLIFLERK